MIIDVESIEAALAGAGWRAGAEALVAEWAAYRQCEIEWEETWKPDDRCRYLWDRPGGERFMLEWVSGDTWEFSILWPESWGREHVRMGWLEDLQDMASSIDRAEGPFGGPPHPRVPVGAISCERGRRLAGDVELRFELLLEDLAAYFFIARDGTLNNLWVVSIDPAHLPAALDLLERTPRHAPSLWVTAQGRRRAWSFTGLRPLLAYAQIGAQDLLLSCPAASPALILAHTAGHLDAAVKLEMRELPDFDAGAWLAHAAPWPTSRRDVRSAGPPLAVDRSGEDPSPPRPPASHDQMRETPPSMSDAPNARRSEVQEPAAAPIELPAPSTVDQAGANSSPAPSPSSPGRPDVGSGGLLASPPPPTDALKTPLAEGPGLAPEPAELAKPRFALAPDASREDIQRHFSAVESAIPPRLTGTATAVELWGAIREAHNHGALPITGNWVDLVSLLHNRGFLSHLPSDRASRAALLILAQLSPLVRRLHHRRWALGVDS